MLWSHAPWHLGDTTLGVESERQTHTTNQSSEAKEHVCALPRKCWVYRVCGIILRSVMQQPFLSTGRVSLLVPLQTLLSAGLLLYVQPDVLDKSLRTIWSLPVRCQ